MVDYSRTIPAGQSGKILAKLNTTNRVGAVSKSIDITSSDPNPVRTQIKLKGTVAGIGLRPSKRAYFFTDRGTERTKEFTLYTIGEPEITISASSNHPFVTAKAEHLENISKPVNEAGKWSQYKIILTLSAEAAPGKLAGKVKIQTSSQVTPELEIFIGGEVRNSISIDPAWTRIWLSTDGLNPPGKFVIRQSQDNKLKILNTESSSEFLEVIIQEKQSGKIFSGSVTWNGPTVTKQQNETVTFFTNDLKVPQLKLRVYINKKK